MLLKPRHEMVSCYPSVIWCGLSPSARCRFEPWKGFAEGVVSGLSHAVEQDMNELEIAFFFGIGRVQVRGDVFAVRCVSKVIKSVEKHVNVAFGWRDVEVVRHDVKEKVSVAFHKVLLIEVWVSFEDIQCFFACGGDMPEAAVNGGIGTFDERCNAVKHKFPTRQEIPPDRLRVGASLSHLEVVEVHAVGEVVHRAFLR